MLLHKDTAKYIIERGRHQLLNRQEKLLVRILAQENEINMYETPPVSHKCFRYTIIEVLVGF